MIGQLKKLGAGDKATDARDKYESIFEKLTNTQLNKLRSAAKKQKPSNIKIKYERA